jgi:lysozyme family protein
MSNKLLTNTERFNFAFDELMKHEGGFSNDPHDPGGPTKFGITQKDIDKFYLAYDLERDVKNLTLESARLFYRYEWWHRYFYYAINSLIVATKIFDMSVNIGPKKAHKIVQLSCNHCGYSLMLDSILGGKTISSLNEISLHNDEEDLINQLCEEQKSYYEYLIEKNPKLKVFEKGWLKRAAWIPNAES